MTASPGGARAGREELVFEIQVLRRSLEDELGAPRCRLRVVGCLDLRGPLCRLG